MQRRGLIGTLLVCGMQAALLFPTLAQQVSDYAVQVSAIIQEDPPQITLSWPPVSTATEYSVYRKNRDDLGWTSYATSLPGNTAAMVDNDVPVGKAYEYRVVRKGPNYEGYGYIYAGIHVPLTDTRGKVILIVDQTHTVGLASELTRLEQDLVGDGWTVLRHDVPRMAINPAANDPSLGLARSNEVAQVKSLIQADYLADPANVRAVFLVGHVPVPYSGSLAPDRHPDHFGAWPADVYYADMEGIWTDSSVNYAASEDPRNRNVPGDGKFDQTELPARLALQVGRVDMANLPAFPQGEQQLLRQYLNKDHHFRHRQFTVERRGFIDDNLGPLSGEVPAVNGWRNFAPMFGAGSISTGRWLGVLPRVDYLWGYGCGGGTFSKATGVADAFSFLVYDTKVVFTMLFGSYFGDWDSQNNFLRAQLATPTYTLTAAWASRPNWYFHHMALGETIGFSARLTQNNVRQYDPNLYMNQVHVALLGDPTLRMHPVQPPSALVAIRNASGGADLQWRGAEDTVLGYLVYRGAAPNGPFTRLNEQFITTTNYVDASTNSDTFYMLRAVQLETSASGTYENPSQGVITQTHPTTTTTSDLTWAEGGQESWKMNHARGFAGVDPGWDWTIVNGTLMITATADNPFAVRIITLDSDYTAGAPASFDGKTSLFWPIITAFNGIIGFDPLRVRLHTSEFQGDLGGGAFSVALSEDSKTINLVFTPNHPPEARPALYSRVPGTTLRIPIGSLLSTFTSDADGDARALVEVGTSTNGSSISIDGGFLVVAPTNDLPESFSYAIKDLREYRAGDTVPIVTNLVNIRIGDGSIDPPPDGGDGEALESAAHHAIEVEWQSQPAKLYQLQFRFGNEEKWSNQGEPIVGTGQKMSVFERASNPAKYYRVIPLD